MMMLRQRQPREKNEAFLRFVRGFPCCVCGAPAPSQAAHIRMESKEHGKRRSGIGERPDDKWCVPLCPGCHLDDPDAQHAVNERVFWESRGVDPFEVADGLWREFNRRRP